MTNQTKSTRFEIFTEWTSGIDGGYSTGMIVEAADEDEAKTIATRRGVCAGLGANRSYVGLIAKRVS